jgi:TonB-linked SusC/RagA family outer membrane protein
MRKLFLILMTLTAVSWSVMAQTRHYSGTVVDAGTDEPLIGATVLPVGGGQGTATDVDGEFTITVPANVKTVKVTYVGYKEQVVTLRDNMKVSLASTSTNLDDVVVVAYGTANKESLTGSVAVVGSDKIEDRPVTSVTSALEGNAPGVQVNSSTGSPGSSPSIRIRGFNSFSSGAQSPLYVVDGVEYNGDIASLNPADIESMSVLKDAASCALYGSRGANGVILITTKKAKSVGKVDVTATVRLGAYTRALPFYDRLGASDWMEASLLNKVNGAVSNGTYASQAEGILANKDSFISSYCQGTNVFSAAANQIFDENGKVVAALNPLYTDLDWWDAISQTGFREEYNINAAGATDKFNAFSSISYLKENGYIIQTDYERFTGRVSANYNPVSYFKMGANIDASYVKSQMNSVEDASDLNVVINPFLTMFNAPIQPYYEHDDEGNIIYDNGSPVWNTSALNKGNNVAWSMRLDKNSLTDLAVNATVYGTAVLPYGFDFTVRGNMYRTKSTYYTYSNNTVGSQKGIGAMDDTSSSTKSYTLSETLNWGHDYGDHHVDAVLVHENRKYAYDQTYVQVTDQILPDMFALSNFSEPVYVMQAANAYTTESYLGRARYNYDQKYFGEFSLNRDGSSQFYKDNRWGTFWSVGGSWIISKEKFMHNLNWVNYLKLRAAYGSVGNNAAAGYQAYLNLYSFTSNSTGVLTSQLGNKDLKWEATKTLDVALEGSLFNDRFNFSVGYFDKINSDLIYSLVLPVSGGSTGATGANPSISTNIGEMQNYGWELAFGVDIIGNANVKWDFNVDFSFVKNKINKLPNGRNIVGSALFQGQSLYEKYTYEFAGVDQMNGRSLYYMNPYSYDYYEYDEDGNWVYNASLYEDQVADAKADADGNQYVEINGVPYTYKTEYAGRKLMGTALPTVYGSFSSSVAWKGINFGVLFTYSLGGKTYDSNYASLMSISSDSPSAIHKDVLKAWTSVPEGMTEDSPNRIDANGVPVINSKFNADNNATSSRFLTSASYLTLKNINISYDLPQKWVSAMKLQNINVGFFMDNVFILSARKGMNPTYSWSGGQGAYFVPNRTYTFQLSVKF